MSSVYFSTIRYVLLSTLICLFLCLCSRQAETKEPLPGTSKAIRIGDPKGVINGYNLYLPRTYGQHERTYPVLVFLQGGLGVGGAIASINNWSLPKILLADTSLHTPHEQLLRDSFIIISPHMTDGGFNERQFYQRGPIIKQILEDIHSQFTTDKRRVYLTGLSRGGHGTWGLATRMKGTFAAIVPIAGDLHGIRDFTPLAKLPIWVIHNEGDDRVNISSSEKAVRTIEELGGDAFLQIDNEDPTGFDYMQHRRIFSSINKEGHDAWTPVYSRADVYKWMLQYRLE